jgi:cytochrome P450
MDTATLSYLERYDGEPDATKLKLVRQFMEEDPGSFFGELRKNRPVLVTPECTLVALFDDVIEMLSMPKVFTVALYEPKMANGYLMSHDDDALHYREKSIMQGFLNREDLPDVRAMVGKICEGLLADAGGEIDAVDGFCRLAPATIVRDYFGLIGMHRKDLMEWSYWAQVDTFYNQPFDIVTPEERERIIKSHDESGEKLGKYIAALVLTRSVWGKFEFLLKPFRKLRRLLTGQKGGLQDDIVARMLRRNSRRRWTLTSNGWAPTRADC